MTTCAWAIQHSKIGSLAGLSDPLALQNFDLFILRSLVPLHVGQCRFGFLMNLAMCQGCECPDRMSVSVPL